MTTVDSKSDVGSPASTKLNQDDYWKYLSQPKTNFTGWYSDYQSRPREQWGTQQMMNPITMAALNAEATFRVRSLAAPKVDRQDSDLYHDLYESSCGRASTMWSVAPAAMTASASARVTTLAKHKEPLPEFLEKQPRPEFSYSCGRISAIWRVQPGAMTGRISNPSHVEKISTPKPLHPDFRINRLAQTVIPELALKAIASDRVHQLSTAKQRNEGLFRDAQWEVSATSKKCYASTRCVELAKNKTLADGYILPRECTWPVTRAAKCSMATPRLINLAQPIPRSSTDHIQFNPDAFKVRESAMKGVIPARIQQLAQPIVR